MTKFNEIEGIRDIISNYECSSGEYTHITLQKDAIVLTEKLLQYEFKYILEYPIFKFLLCASKSKINQNSSFPIFSSFYKNLIDSYLTDSDSQLVTNLKIYLLLILSISLLEFYLQLNYTGPYNALDTLEEYNNISAIILGLDSIVNTKIKYLGAIFTSD